MKSRPIKRLINIAACLPIFLAASSLHAQPYEHESPQVYRLDQHFDRAIESAPSPPATQDIFRLIKVISKHLNIYARLGYRNPALYAKIAFSNSSLAQDIEHTRAFFNERHLTTEVLTLHQNTLDAIGIETPSPTNYYLAYGHRLGTNAQTISGTITQDGHNHIYLNLVALAQQRHWEIAVRHETIHTLQDLSAQTTLLERSITEGVPTYLSQVLENNISDAEALFWTPEQWQAAESHRTAIIQAFSEQRHETDLYQMRPFLQLNVLLQSVPGAPDRTGYYVGFLAVKAWVSQNPQSPLSDLFKVTPDEFWQALQEVSESSQ